MDKEYIKKLTKDPRFIPGIYNDCDRWCERCPLTSHCMNFALSEEEFGHPRARDINNEVFWQRLHQVFQVTLEMVKETAKEQGIDLERLDLQQAVDEYEVTRDTTENHQCALAAKAYAEMVKTCFDSAQEPFEQQADDGEAEELRD